MRRNWFNTSLLFNSSRHWAAALLFLVSACAEAPSSPDASTAKADAGTPDSGRLLSGPLIGPERYDCRSPGLPSRSANALPLNCAFDPDCNENLVVGHRSAGGVAPGLGVLAPENSMSALRAAIVLGADFIETDPRATKDGVIVNVHDTDLSGTTTSTKVVAESTWDEIKDLQLVFPSTIQGDFSCDRIVSIRELLIAAKGRINVLLDANKLDEADVPKLVSLIRETDSFAEAVFDTSSLSKVLMARALAPEIKIHIRPNRPEEIEAQILQVGAPPPVIIEIDLSDLDDSVLILKSILPGASIMVDTLGGLDFQSAVAGHASMDTLDLYARGAKMIQTDRIDLLIHALGRLPK